MLDSNADRENTNKPAFSKTTEIRITREATAPNIIFQSVAESSIPISRHLPPLYCSPYTVTIEGGQGSGIPLKPLGPERSDSHLHHRAMMAEANSAAWAYTKCAMLFFIALIITWVSMATTLCYFASVEGSRILTCRGPTRFRPQSTGYMLSCFLKHSIFH